MSELSGWEIALLAIAGFVAVTGLVKLMRARHSELTAKLREEMRQDQQRRQEAERTAKRKAQEEAKKNSGKQPAKAG